MLPTVSEVYAQARAFIGDDLIPAGEVFTDAVLQPHYQTAYAEMWRELDRIDSPFLQTDCYKTISANMSYLTPATAGIPNMGEIVSVKARPAPSVASLIGAALIVPASPGIMPYLGLTLLSSLPTLQNGDMAILENMAGLSLDANGVFSISVTNPTTVRVIGVTPTGTYSANTGIFSSSREGFRLIHRVPQITDYNPPGDTITHYSWTNNVFRFQPSSRSQQLLITYEVSGQAPLDTTATILLDDSRDFLAARCGQLASATRGMPQTEERLRNMAARFLDTALDLSVRSLQGLPARSRQGSSFAVRPRQYWA